MFSVTIICIKEPLHDCFKDICGGYNLLRGRKAFSERNYTLLLEVIFVKKQVWQGSTDTNSTCHARVELSKDDDELLWTVKIVKWLPEAWLADIDQGQIYVFEVGAMKHFSFIAVMQIGLQSRRLHGTQPWAKGFLSKYSTYILEHQQFI